MPIVPKSDYQKPKLLLNGHLETIVPGLFRSVAPPQPFVRERIDTPDGDFLDLDWLKHRHNKQLVVLSHGLEGDSQRPYMLGMARAFFNTNHDVLAWNFRGCSGVMNRKKIFYHSGATYDLETVIGHAVRMGYEQIALIGFSLGGNLTLKYLGENTTEKFDEVKKAVAFSVPLDLADCSREIDQPHNLLYARRFLKSLKKKVAAKHTLFNGQFDLEALHDVRSLYEFDDLFTGPLHGFASAEDYYHQCSSLRFLSSIKIKTLVVNAQNDPFLSDSCLDQCIFTPLKSVYFESPDHGGHVGFSQYNPDRLFWSEIRALEFINEEKESV